MKVPRHSRAMATERVAREMLGSSLKGQIDRARSFAHSASIVVITGEAGVGKSLLAAHMHAHGRHRDRSMLSINIATSGDRHQRLSLLGADFTHLTSSKRSLLEHPGTVLIKHIDKACLALQESLAEALNAGSINRPGSIRAKPVHCQIIFTLRKGVKECSEDSTLERSLAQILAPAPAIHIPPLRERRSDLPGIARSLYGRPLPDRLAKTLLEHPWPGNVAELRASIDCLKPRRTSGRLPDRCRRELSQMLLRIEEGTEFSLRHSLSVIERGIIYHALKRTDGHRAKAAQLLGLTDTALRWHIDRIRNSP
jgi:DNA-binding NtrC family response regulator